MNLKDVVLTTKRLTLRPFNGNDLLDLHEYASVEGVGELAGWTHHQSMNESYEVLQMFMENDTFAIVFNDKVIGSIEYFNENIEEKSAELGFVLSKAFWGQGLMVEAVNALIDYGFNTLKLARLYCGYFPHNNQSKRVQEKCGFTYLNQIHKKVNGVDQTINMMVLDHFPGNKEAN